MNPTPVTIPEARALAKRHRLRTLICLYELPDGRIGFTSYGETNALCERARRIGDRLYEEMADAIAGEGA